MRVLGIVGSLRKESFNRKLAAAAGGLASGFTIEPYLLHEIPLYNTDLDVEGARPAEVERFKKAIADADGLLFFSPEYNHTIPGVLQNAIDWASRPGFKSVFVDKPAGLMGASGGPIGTARMQQQLKVVLIGMLALVMPHPGVAVGMAAEKFDPEGALVHEPTRQLLAAYLQQFERWIRRMNARSG